MTQDPYQAPETEELSVEGKKSSIWWKIYFFFIIILAVPGILRLLGQEDVGVIDYFCSLTNCAIIIGLFGFVFRKRILISKIWLIVAIIAVIEIIFHSFIMTTDPKEEIPFGILLFSTILNFLFWLPAFIGLFLYSRPSNNWWSDS